ncbi:MAG: hypothetical protein QXP81_09450 [Nitrososphaerota archaeon]
MAYEEVIEWIKERLAKIEQQIAELEAERERWKRVLGLFEQRSVGSQEVAFTEDDLNALPWRPYQSGRGEWVFEDQSPRKLVERLNKEGREEIGGYVYSLKEGTRGKRFVSRRPSESGTRESRRSMKTRAPRSRELDPRPEELTMLSSR